MSAHDPAPASVRVEVANVHQVQVPLLLNLVFGCISNCSATLVLHPLDVARVRVQVMGSSGKAAVSNTPPTLMSTFRNSGGIRSLYDGLSAGMLRQLSYGTMRFGLYNTLMDRVHQQQQQQQQSDGKNSADTISFATKLGLGMVAGGFASVFGNPTEVALVRMSADRQLPKAERRNYPSAVHALVRITRDEGVVTLWRGCAPTVVRAMILNMCQLGIYSQAKSVLSGPTWLDLEPTSVRLQLCAALVSGIFTTCCCVPFDYLKTSIQNAPDKVKMSSVVVRTVRDHGVQGLWRGAVPFYLKLAPHTVISFLIMEQCRQQWRVR